MILLHLQWVMAALLGAVYDTVSIILTVGRDSRSVCVHVAYSIQRGTQGAGAPLWLRSYTSIKELLRYL